MAFILSKIEMSQDRRVRQQMRKTESEVGRKGEGKNTQRTFTVK